MGFLCFPQYKLVLFIFLIFLTLKLTLAGTDSVLYFYWQIHINNNINTVLNLNYGNDFNHAKINNIVYHPESLSGRRVKWLLTWVIIATL